MKNLVRVSSLFYIITLFLYFVDIAHARLICTKNAHNLSSSFTDTYLSVPVPRPTLSVSLGADGFPNGIVPLGSTFIIQISVTASDSGVGGFSDLTFQGGAITSSNSEVLSYPLNNITPFALSRAETVVYNINVTANSVGEVILSSSLRGKDAGNAIVSAISELKLTVVDTRTTSDQISTLIGRATYKVKIPVTLTNSGANTVRGRLRLIKPTKSKAARAVVAYSAWINFDLPAGTSIVLSLRTFKVVKSLISEGKSVKASLVMELEGISDFVGAINKTTSVVLKKAKNKKVK